jgi:hypothetical protein
VAVLSLRANLPDTMPGQSVTFLLMGNAQIENAVALRDTSYDEGRREASTRNCTGPICVWTYWTTPPLAPGQHTIQTTYTLTQFWHWGPRENDFAGPGTVDTDTCVITVE